MTRLIMCKAHFLEEDEHPTTDTVGVSGSETSNGVETPRPDWGIWLQDRVCTDRAIAEGRLQPDRVFHASLATICWLHGEYEPAGDCPHCEAGQ